jgi:PAS domain-containing protein
MQKTFAGDDRAITILAAESGPYTPATTTMPIRKPRAAARRASHGPVSSRGKSRTAAAAKSDGVAAGFYRDLVWNLRNGVLAVTRDGRIAVMNDVAYRILGLTPGTTDIGLPFGQVLKDRPDVSRIVAGAFDLSHLPNRAELRLKNTG